MAVRWAVAPRGLVEVYKRLRGASASIIGAIIALMMETVITSEMSINFYQITRRNSPADSHLHTRRRENLKSLSFIF
jgi:hypothetical protein